MKRLLLFLAVAALALAAVAGIWRSGLLGAPPASQIGGPFHLVDQNGEPVDQTLLEGRWTAVYFGYTFCPDACPTTLATLAQAIDRLGPQGRTVQVVFISVDPARDTPSQLKAYLRSPSFPRGAVGLTGTPGQTSAAARAYRVYWRKVGAGPAYTLDHTSIIYLMDPRGRFARPIGYGLSPKEMADQIAAAMQG